MATMGFKTIFFCLIISQSFAESLFSLPRYDELLYLASAKKIQEPNARARALLSKFYNSEGRNYLDVMAHEASMSRNSENPKLMAMIRNKLKNLVCDKLSPNISTECCSDVEEMFMGVLSKKLWAFKMLDAFGKLSSGLIEGNVHFSGSEDECLDADVSIDIPGSKQMKSYKPFNPKYCQVGFPIQLFEQMASMMPEDSIAGVLFGTCLPDSCHSSEIKYFIETGLHLVPFNLTENITTIVRCPEDLKFDTKAIASLVIIGILVGLVVLGTFVDVFVYQLPKFRQPPNSDIESSLSSSSSSALKSISTQDPNLKVGTLKKKDESSFLVEFFLCFSIYKNATKLFNTNVPKGNLTSLHGIRFISMMWVILGHTYIFGISVWRNLATVQALFQRFTFQVVANALFSVDTFFMLSGLLVTYGMMKTLKKQEETKKSPWLYFYIHRFWRLTPPYMLVMMVYIPLFQYWGDGPYWPQTGIEINYCHDTWWYNLLYINNFLTDITKGMCMPWTWYLSNDMQFYIISPLILYPLYKKPKLGGLVLLVFLLVHFITSGVISTVHGFGPSMFTASTETPVDYFKDIYIKPWTRIGPYLIGMVYGFLLHQNKCRVYINKYIVGMIWLFGSVCALAVIYGLYDYSNGDPVSQSSSSFYTAVARTAWGLSVGWVIYACSTGYGGFVNTLLSWKAFIPLSRLTYSAYLVHPVIIQSYYLSQRYTIYLTDFEIIYLFLGHLVLSFAAAFVVSMIFEAPMIALESLLTKKNKKNK